MQSERVWKLFFSNSLFARIRASRYLAQGRRARTTPCGLSLARVLTARSATNDERDPRTLLDGAVWAPSAMTQRRTDSSLKFCGAAGTVTGGRVLHHLAQRLPDPNTTALFTGFQAAGTRGRTLQDGARTLRIFGREVEVRATIETIDGLSAHADQNEILAWLRGFRSAPKATYLVHGAPQAADALRARIEADLGWSVRVARDGERLSLASKQEERTSSL